MLKKENLNPSKEKLLAEIGRLKRELKKKKKYGLVWEDKPEDVVEMCKEKLPVLKEIRSKEIIADKNKPINLLIEGDNYHALSVLSYTHAKKIDVVYIDPPYNRGSNDFKYNDKFVDKEDGYRHSKWLGFMKARLTIAKKILRDTGVIFVSIDENEFAPLKILFDEIFGEINFVGNLIWKRRGSIGSFAERNLTHNHEYILVYKNIKGFLLKNIVGSKRKSEFKNSDERGLFRWIGLVGPSQQTKLRRPNLDYGILYDTKNDKIIGFVDKNKKRVYFDNKYSNKIIEIWLNGEATWLIGKDGIKKFYKRGIIKVFKKKDNYNLQIKNYFYDPDGQINGTLLKSILSDNDVNIGMNSEGTSQIKEILFPKDFSDMKPKPVSLIKFLIDRRSFKDSIILDFFAGTGTTGHAVLEMNKDDGGKRQFILCTNNENNIAIDVCYPRVKNIIEGYKNSKGEKVAGLGGNLKYFKTDFVDYKEATDKNKIKLTKEAVEMLCIKEGTFELIQENEDFKIFRNHEHYTGIIFDQLAIKNFKKGIRNIKSKFSVYVFSLGDDSFDEEFEDIKQKVKLSPIPEAILKVYRRIYK